MFGFGKRPAAAVADDGRIHARFLVRHAGFTLDVDLDLPGRGVTALFGHSGSGKSTLLNILGLLERMTSGSFRLDGEEVQGLDDAVQPPLPRDDETGGGDPRHRAGPSQDDRRARAVPGPQAHQRPADPAGRLRTPWPPPGRPFPNSATP